MDRTNGEHWGNRRVGLRKLGNPRWRPGSGASLMSARRHRWGTFITPSPRREDANADGPSAPFV